MSIGMGLGMGMGEKVGQGWGWRQVSWSRKRPCNVDLWMLFSASVEVHNSMVGNLYSPQAKAFADSLIPKLTDWITWSIQFANQMIKQTNKMLIPRTELRHSAFQNPDSLWRGFLRSIPNQAIRIESPKPALLTNLPSKSMVVRAGLGHWSHR